MRKLAIVAAAALMLTGSVGAANAQYWRGGYHGGYYRNGWGGGGAVAAGLIGGAIIRRADYRSRNPSVRLRVWLRLWLSVICFLWRRLLPACLLRSSLLLSGRRLLPSSYLSAGRCLRAALLRAALWCIPRCLPPGLRRTPCGLPPVPVRARRASQRKCNKSLS